MVFKEFTDKCRSYSVVERPGFSGQNLIRRLSKLEDVAPSAYPPIRDLLSDVAVSKGKEHFKASEKLEVTKPAIEPRANWKNLPRQPIPTRPETRPLLTIVRRGPRQFNTQSILGGQIPGLLSCP